MRFSEEKPLADSALLSPLNATPNECQVAVVGFGTSGAVAAALLGQYEIRAFAFDRMRNVYDRPRAIAIDHEILRLFDNIGVAERVLLHVAPFPASQHFTWRNVGSWAASAASVWASIPAQARTIVIMHDWEISRSVQALSCSCAVDHRVD